MKNFYKLLLELTIFIIMNIILFLFIKYFLLKISIIGVMCILYLIFYPYLFGEIIVHIHALITRGRKRWLKYSLRTLYGEDWYNLLFSWCWGFMTIPIIIIIIGESLTI